MIVVDSNVVAYCWIRSERTEIDQRVRLCDPAWHVPVLWRTEVRSALSGYMGQGTMKPDRAAAIMAQAEGALAGCEHLVASGAVLELAARARLSAYDCEFVALAQSLAVPLVTEDRAVLKALSGGGSLHAGLPCEFPGRAASRARKARALPGIRAARGETGARVSGRRIQSGGLEPTGIHEGRVGGGRLRG